MDLIQIYVANMILNLHVELHVEIKLKYNNYVQQTQVTQTNIRFR